MKRFKILVTSLNPLLPEGIYTGSIWAERIREEVHDQIQFLVADKVIAIIWKNTQIRIEEEIPNEPDLHAAS